MQTRVARVRTSPQQAVHRPLWLVAVWGMCAGTVMAQSVSAPTTVSEAVFRSQWVGPQADRFTPGMFAPTESREIEPLTDWAAKLREGLSLRSLRINPGLGLGWEYSNRTSQGNVTTGGDDNSPYVAPTLGLSFAREYGPWDLSLSYGGGWVYYVNPDYTTDQSGRQRNPLNQTVSMRLGHQGLRHEGSVRVNASYGTGENIQIGGTTTQFQFGTGGDYSYILNDFVTLGLFATYSGSVIRYGNNNQQGTDVTRFRFGGTADWLWTGKTTLGLKVEAGQTTQMVQSSGDVNDGRQFVQMLVTSKHSLTAKLLINAGVGAGYVQDIGIRNVDTRYTGIRPVYQVSMSYIPSEKTFIRVYSNFEGTEIVPDYGLQVGWSPRPTTSLSASVYQDQNYSLNSSSQYQVNQGFIATIRQIFFSKITVGVSGGWQQTENVSLIEGAGGSSNFNYSFLSGNIRWDLNDWLYWQATVWSSTGNRRTGTSSNYPETIASTGLNLIF